MALTTTQLADGTRSASCQILLTEPELLLTDGRILPFLSRFPTCSGGGRCAWELLFTSAATDRGVALQARLIAHTSLPGRQAQMLAASAAAAAEKLLAALRENGVAAVEAADRLPTVPAAGLIALCKRDGALLPAEVELTAGQLRQRLCASSGNALSLLLVLSQWRKGEIEMAAAGLDDRRRAMLAQDAVFDFAVTLWGPDAQANAAWLQELTLERLTAVAPAKPTLFPLCLRRDPWHALTLLPGGDARRTCLTLSELLTVCGCPSEPGEMQRMCRTGWRAAAQEALDTAQLPLLPSDLTLQPDDLAFLNLQSDSDLTDVLSLNKQMSEMLRMCMAILRKLGALHLPGMPRQEAAHPQRRLLGCLLPAVGHIYEQFVRECCYETMYAPYYAYAAGRPPRRVTRIPLSAYDQGPEPGSFRLLRFTPGTPAEEMQCLIRERMIDDFTAHASLRGRRLPDVYWYSLFNDMNTARAQRNGMTHEAADLRAAEIFARVFLWEQPGEKSLLRRLLLCREIAANFPPA